jgi:vitamin B12 transporter
MILTLILAAASAPATPVPAGQDEIVVTANKPDKETSLSAAERPVRTHQGLAEAVGLPMVTDVLRIVPGVSVAASGPRGSQTQVRLEGAEANHTLLVVDGIRFNDPAAGNEARFELLPTDLLDRINVILGSDSALWGSEAIGGVIDTATRAPGYGRPELGARAEFGSLDSGRASAWLAGQAPLFGDRRLAFERRDRRFRARRRAGRVRQPLGQRQDRLRADRIDTIWRRQPRIRNRRPRHSRPQRI